MPFTCITRKLTVMGFIACGPHPFDHPGYRHFYCPMILALSALIPWADAHHFLMSMMGVIDRRR